MRRIVGVLGVAAAILIAGSVAQAVDLVCGNPDNTGNCDPNFPGSPPGPSQGPYAATGGAIWIKTGSADPIAVDFDVNLEFLIQHDRKRRLCRLG